MTAQITECASFLEQARVDAASAGRCQRPDYQHCELHSSHAQKRQQTGQIGVVFATAPIFGPQPATLRLHAKPDLDSPAPHRRAGALLPRRKSQWTPFT
jgi:hypothetical protein